MLPLVGDLDRCALPGLGRLCPAPQLIDSGLAEDLALGQQPLDLLPDLGRRLRRRQLVESLGTQIGKPCRFAAVNGRDVHEIPSRPLGHPELDPDQAGLDREQVAADLYDVLGRAARNALGVSVIVA